MGMLLQGPKKGDWEGNSLVAQHTGGSGLSLPYRLVPHSHLSPRQGLRDGNRCAVWGPGWGVSLPCSKGPRPQAPWTSPVGGSVGPDRPLVVNLTAELSRYAPSCDQSVSENQRLTWKRHLVTRLLLLKLCLLFVGSQLQEFLSFFFNVCFFFLKKRNSFVDKFCEIHFYDLNICLLRCTIQWWRFQ